MKKKYSKLILWESYKNHIDNLIKSSKEISKEILPPTLPIAKYDYPKDINFEDLEDEDIEDDLDGSSGYNFLLPKSVMQDVSMIINHECWIGHTNFDITEDIAEKLNIVDGVELLKIVGRYQFVIGLGKCFKFNEVRSSINNLLKIETK